MAANDIRKKPKLTNAVLDRNRRFHHWRNGLKREVVLCRISNMSIGEIVSTLVGIALFVFVIACAWNLVEKTGNPGWLSLLFWVPFVNLALLLYFVFSEWPIEQELRSFKARYGKLDDEMDAPTTCLHCGATIPAQSATCASCGWSYNAGDDAGNKGEAANH